MGPLLVALLMTASAQERADLPREIDTWYTVLKGREAVGYVHETLKQAVRPSGYDYLLEYEIDLKGHSEELSFTAVLDETLTPTECSADAHADGFPSGFTMYTRDDRRLEARRFVGDPTLWTQPGRDDFHLLPSLTLYALRQNGTFDKPGRTTLRAVDPRGVEKGGIEVVLEAGETVQRQIRGKQSPLTPVTFLKPFPAAARETELRDVLLDRYGRIVEATMVGGARLVIVDKIEALAAVGSVRRMGRRDIFNKLEAMRYAARERDRLRHGEPEIPRPIVTPDSLMSDLETARKMADEIRAHKEAGELDEARKTYLKMLVHLQAIRGVAAKKQPLMLPQINEVRDLAETAWPGAEQVRKDASAEFVKVKAQMDDLNLEAMEGTHKALQAFGDRIEVEGRPERKAIGDWTAEVGTLVLQCRTRRDLARMRLDITAIAIGEVETKEVVEIPFRQELPFIRPFVEAEINGRVYRVGGTIQGTQVRVDKITRHSVQVSLRDQTREVPLR